jgi:soluble lytic murein transglycosylase-like protein
MILARARRNSFAAPLALALPVLVGPVLVGMATPARADVLELDANGARWVAGGPVLPVEQGGMWQAGEPTDAAAPTASPAGFPVAPLDGRSDGAFAPAANSVVVPDRALSDSRVSAAGVPARYAAKIAELSRRFDLSPSLLEALVWQESRWREDAVSPAGARGLTQLMPGTARYLGVNPEDPMQNLEGGARYLREQLDRFDGNLEKALAAYNAGPGRVIKAGGVPNIRETRAYVAAIMGRLADHSRPAASQ